MATLKQISNARKYTFETKYPYKLTYWEEYDYSLLSYIVYKKKAGRGDNRSYNNAVIMGDTETSKKPNSTHNHVVAWTISIRAFDLNLVTLWGRKPSDMIECFNRIHTSMKGEETYVLFHNLAYDWVFLRQFFFEMFGKPKNQLNTKSHYPISIEWENGFILRDSLILAQRSLEKWSSDLNVEHQKAVGKWDYNKLRNQDEEFTQDELEYIEHDTLSGVECIDSLMKSLNKNIYSMPFTATGIPREEVRKLAKENHFKETFKKIAPDFEQYKKASNCYHGGFTHANRHFLDMTITGDIQCRDFASSYPFVMLSEKYPMTKFEPVRGTKPIEYIVRNSELYAFMFKLILIGVRLKSDVIPMPILQISKCIKTINAVLDNGRILCAEYVEIYITEQDAKLIYSQYDFHKDICCEIEVATKDYLPRWFTDYIFQLFTDKTMLKGGDPVIYGIKKSTLNSLYGLCCQKSIRDEILEDYDTGEFTITSQMTEEAYNKYLKSPNSVLPYTWGLYVTCYAMVNLHTLGSTCVDFKNGGEWYYSDTDSCYSNKWDEEALSQYNARCIEKLKANGYGGVEFNGRMYYLGIAEKDACYSEYRFLGAKRYCGRDVETGKLKITVAGVPKKKGSLCLNDDISNFTKGTIFSGKITGKLTHSYNYVDKIYIDEYGNETGDSINLTECDYLLDVVGKEDWINAYEEIEIGGFHDYE